MLIWFASGVIMSFLPIENVRGEHLVDRESVVPLPSGVDLSRLNNTIGNAKSVSVNVVDGRVIARVERGAGDILLIDALTGQRLPPFDAVAAERIVRSAWRGDKSVNATTQKVITESTEYRGGLPAWRVALSDAENTSVYIEADSGRIAAVRNGTWRLYDFFWGLHIMDWKNHENFNTWWLLMFAVGGLVLGIAGTILLIIRWPFRRRRKAKRLASS